MNEPSAGTVSPYSIPIFGSIALDFDRVQINKPVEHVLESQVPELDPRLDTQTLKALSEGNLIVEKIVPLIDGRRHVRAIARDAAIDLTTCKMVFQHLDHFGLIRLYDLF